MDLHVADSGSEEAPAVEIVDDEQTSGARCAGPERVRCRICDRACRIVARVSVARRHVKNRTAGRTVLLHPAARAALAAWVFELRQRGGVAPDTWLFRSRKRANAPISRGHAWRILRRAFAAAGVAGNLGTHVMRKTFADRIYARLDRDLVKTQRALGHRCIESTAAYISFRQEEIDEAILSL